MNNTISGVADTSKCEAGTRNHLLRAQNLINDGQYYEAYKVLKQALELEPASGHLWYCLGLCLHEITQREAAIMAYDRAIELNFEISDLHRYKAKSLITLNRYEEARKSLDKALSLEPDSINVLYLKSNLCDIVGDQDGVLNCCDLILSLKPGDPVTLYNLIRLKSLPEKYIELYKLDLKTHLNYSWEEKTYLYFAKAAFERKQGAYDTAFSWYAKANNILKEKIPFDRENFTLRADLHIEYFTKQSLSRFQDYGSLSTQPIFIVGMPRSGTTLLEQIISSHPSVTAAGELNYIAKIEQQLVSASQQAGSVYPRNLPSLSPDSMEQFGNIYLHNARQHCREETPHFIDKMPENFFNIGLIKLLFPKAKIIHISRNALDTCLSSYFIRYNNLRGLSFSHDLEDLGFYYNGYKRLMEHWINIFGESICHVQYENLVTNSEETVRGVLEYLNLDWSDNCLNFYQSDRAIMTASRNQVRQPIYKSSIGQWKNYKKYISPLIDILKASD